MPRALAIRQGDLSPFQWPVMKQDMPDAIYGALTNRVL